MAFTYNDDLSDSISRVRLAVGDTVSPGLLPDASYTAQWALAASDERRVQTSASDDTLAYLSDNPLTAAAALDNLGITPRYQINVAAPIWQDGDAVVVTRALASCGLTRGAIYYVANADVYGATIQLAMSIGGSAVNITADTTLHIGRLDEAAAARKPVLRWTSDSEATAKTA